MKKLLLVLLAGVLCSCGDDITKNTYVQEPSYLDVRTEFNEPCDPGEGALDTNGRIWICRGNGTWHKQEHFVDTIFKWQRDTIIITRKDTVFNTRTDTIVINNDSGEDTDKICGTTQYDSTTHFCDERDNRIYRYVKFGDKIWMAENLNYGDSLQKVCYDDNEENCEIYGGLYNYIMATNTNGVGHSYPQRGVCPYGWHIPDSLEWTNFLSFVKSFDTFERFVYETGFDYLFAGQKHDPFCRTDNMFCTLGTDTFWEVASSHSPVNGSGGNGNCQRAIQYLSGNEIPSFTYPQSISLFYKSVRCIKDN